MNSGSTTSDKRTALQEALRILAEYGTITDESTGGVKKELDEKLEREKKRILDTWAAQAGIELRYLIGAWHRRLAQAFEISRVPVPPERILCGFNSTVDTTYQLGKSGQDERVDPPAATDAAGQAESGAVAVARGAGSAVVNAGSHPARTPKEILDFAEWVSLHELDLLRNLIQADEKRLEAATNEGADPQKIARLQTNIEALRGRDAQLTAVMPTAASTIGSAARAASSVANAYHQNERQKPERLTQLTSEVRTPYEMLEALFLAMLCPKEEWKPSMDRPLWKPVCEYINTRSNAQLISRIGGASGNMAYALDQLGLETVVHWPYHPKELATSCQGLKNLKRYLPDERELKSAKAHGQCPVHSGDPRPDPMRRNYSFDFSNGMLVDPEVTAQKAGRVIFLSGQHLTGEGPERGWNSLALRTGTRAAGQLTARWDREVIESSFHGDGWPFFPLFASKQIEGDELVFEVTPDDPLRAIAGRFDYFLLGGIQVLGQGFFGAKSTIDGEVGPEARTLVKHALARQLDVLREEGVVIHWEIGNITSPETLDDLCDVVKGRVSSASLGHSELATITAGNAYKGSRFVLEPIKHGMSEIFERYRRAIHLAKQLGMDQLYVHGNDVDLIIRRRATRGALRHEVAMTLFAKGVVVLNLVERSGYPLVEKMEDAQFEVPRLLIGESFALMVELAHDLGVDRYPEDREGSNRIMNDVLSNGYYFERKPEEYSVMIVPLMWPELPIGFSTAGAGDTTSSVMAVYAGL